MGAVEPEAPKPEKRTYRVGPRPVFGVEAGKTFEAELDPAQEARLLKSGAITKSAAKNVDEKTVDESATNTKE